MPSVTRAVASALSIGLLALLAPSACGGDTGADSASGGAGATGGGASGGSSGATAGGGGATGGEAGLADATADVFSPDGGPDGADASDCSPPHGGYIVASCCGGKPCEGLCSANGECECFGIAGGCSGGLRCCKIKGCTTADLCDWNA